MFVVGIDEAGYGPLLGPLVVASCTLRCENEYDPEMIWSALGTKWGIADSKLVLSHRNMASGEETVMALLEALDLQPKTRHELFEKVLVPPPHFDLTETEPNPFRCIQDDVLFRRTCEWDERAVPRWGETPPRSRAEDLLSRLASVGVSLVSARAIALCPGLYNDALGMGLNKATVNWRLFAQLLRHDQEKLEKTGFAACGKLGGRHQYGSLLIDLGLSSVITEGRARSAYVVDGYGQVEFIRSAESAHPPVAMASMVAKLVREHTLDRWHSLFSSHLPELQTCSGYRDSVTKAYVKQTEGVRERLGIPESCFLRKK